MSLIGNNIRYLRNKRGLSQDYIAEHLGYKSALLKADMNDIVNKDLTTNDFALAATGTFFGLQIYGDSMEPKISNGDVVIVRQQDDADSGDIVIAMVNGDDAACKRLRKYREGIELISNNPTYAPMFFSNEEIKNKPVKIIGKVVELRAKF